MPCLQETHDACRCARVDEIEARLQLVTVAMDYLHLALRDGEPAEKLDFIYAELRRALYGELTSAE